MSSIWYPYLTIRWLTANKWPLTIARLCLNVIHTLGTMKSSLVSLNDDLSCFEPEAILPLREENRGRVVGRQSYWNSSLGKTKRVKGLKGVWHGLLWRPNPHSCPPVTFPGCPCRIRRLDKPGWRIAPRVLSRQFVLGRPTALQSHPVNEWNHDWCTDVDAMLL